MDINQLYRSVIMDHYRNPKNKGLTNDTGYITISLNNPSCGDEIVVQFKRDKDTIMSIKHQGTGCSICCSSASVMSQTLESKSICEVKIIMNEFYNMLMGHKINTDILVGDEVAYQGVAKFPARIKCATLAWKALEIGLEEWKGSESLG